jgi:hypothetical protein
MSIDLDAYHARKAAEAADGLLDQSAEASDAADPATLALAVAGMGRAVLSLAIGVNRLAETAEHFTGGPGPRPGIDEITGAIDRLSEAIGQLAS